MDRQTRQTHEDAIRELMQAGEAAAAAELALDLYGGELLGYLMGTLQDQSAAEDVFQDLSLEMWSALPAFEWRSSLRTWLYALARGVLTKHLRDPYHRRGTPLSPQDEAALPMRLARTATRTWRKTASKDRLQAICAQLPQDDRELLLLRLGRQMTWPEIADVFVGDQAPAPETLRTISARLRKRYERIKERLRDKMSEDGTA